MAAEKRSNEDIAKELEDVAGALGGAYSRILARIAAEMQGHQLPPTENEVREAAAAEAAAAEAATANEGDSTS